MSMSRNAMAPAPIPCQQAPRADAALEALPVPAYLEQVYWWAYVHPRSVNLFEREWLVNLILFGNYARLRDVALEALGQAPLQGHTLQIACVYGNLTPRLLQRLGAQATLEVVDILPIQLKNLDAKLPVDSVRLTRSDSSALPHRDASVDRALLFFLLHEQPEDVRRATLAEAMRVLKPGGRLVIVDYHRPAKWHPLRPLMGQVFSRLEPYAFDLWTNPVAHFLPERDEPYRIEAQTFFGGLYQMLVITR